MAIAHLLWGAGCGLAGALAGIALAYGTARRLLWGETHELYYLFLWLWTAVGAAGVGAVAVGWWGVCTPTTFALVAGLVAFVGTHATERSLRPPADLRRR